MLQVERSCFLLKSYLHLTVKTIVISHVGFISWMRWLAPATVRWIYDIIEGRVPAGNDFIGETLLYAPAGKVAAIHE